MTKLLLSLLLLCLVSCGTSPSKILSQPQPTSEVALSEKYREDYARRWTAFRCEKSGVPAADIHTLGDDVPKPSWLLSGELQLSLKFGKAYAARRAPERWRTESRYVLRILGGRELGRAESLLTGPHQGMVKVVYCPASGCVLIEESLSGAGNPMRHLVFERDAITSNWTVHYLELPRRQTPFDETVVGHVLSVANGKVYVETDGLYYAFPIGEHLARTLEFMVG